MHVSLTNKINQKSSKNRFWSLNRLDKIDLGLILSALF